MLRWLVAEPRHRLDRHHPRRHQGAWEKPRSWAGLDFQQVNYGADRNVKIGPADRDTHVPRNLPDKTVETDYTPRTRAPTSGGAACSTA